MIRYDDDHATRQRIRELPSLTNAQVTALVAPFAVALVRHMDAWTMEGRPRTGRRYSQYANCPLPTAEDRLRFILSSLNVAALQVAHGALFGMSQSNANTWIHVLVVVLQQTLVDLGDLPARHLQDLRVRLEALHAPDRSESPPLFITTARSAQFHAPTTRMSRTSVRAARNDATR